jgi:hypothetical protein
MPKIRILNQAKFQVAKVSKISLQWSYINLNIKNPFASLINSQKLRTILFYFYRKLNHSFNSSFSKRFKKKQTLKFM